MTREGHPGVAPSRSPIYGRVCRCAPTTATRRTSCASPSASRCCRQSRHEARRPRDHRRRVPGGRPAAAPFGDHVRVDPRPRRRAAVGAHTARQCPCTDPVRRRTRGRRSPVARTRRGRPQTRVGLCAITLGRVRRQPTRPGEFDGDTTTRKGREGNTCPASPSAPAATDAPDGPSGPSPACSRRSDAHMGAPHRMRASRPQLNSGRRPGPPRRPTPIVAAPPSVPADVQHGQTRRGSNEAGCPPWAPRSRDDDIRVSSLDILGNLRVAPDRTPEAQTGVPSAEGSTRANGGSPDAGYSRMGRIGEHSPGRGMWRRSIIPVAGGRGASPPAPVCT